MEPIEVIGTDAQMQFVLWASIATFVLLRTFLCASNLRRRRKALMFANTGRPREANFEICRCWYAPWLFIFHSSLPNNPVSSYYQFGSLDRKTAFVTGVVFKPSGKITIPKKLTSTSGKFEVTRIGKMAFRNCRLVSAVTIPEGVHTLGMSAFQGCDSLASIEFPKSLRIIGAWSFGGCVSLASVSFSEGLMEIGESAFRLCIALRSVVLPEGLQSLGSCLFAGCASLKSVAFLGSSPRCGSDLFRGTSEELVVYVKKGTRGWGENLDSSVLPATWQNRRLVWCDSPGEMAFSSKRTQKIYGENVRQEYAPCLTNAITADSRALRA